MNPKKIKRLKKSLPKKTGLPPGTIMYVGSKKEEKVSLSEIDFSPDSFNETELTNINQSKNWDNPEFSTWISVGGIHDISIIEAVGRHFKLNNLILEDIVNSQHMPKFEDHEDGYIFVVLKALSVNEEKKTVVPHQVSLILNKNWILSFDEGDFQQFDSFKDRIRQAKGIIRERKPPYLFYRLIDIIVDNYFLATDFIADQLDDIEESILSDPDIEINNDLYKIKKEITAAKKAIAPLREIISGLLKDDSGILNDDTKNYLRDVYEHVIHAMETLDNQRESVSDFLNLYMSALSIKMNEVMKVLTIFAAIFIPLTFIAGIYGMNFEYMPELSWKYGYFAIWGLMIGVTALLLYYFKRKKWF